MAEGTSSALRRGGGAPVLISGHQKSIPDLF